MEVRMKIDRFNLIDGSCVKCAVLHNDKKCEVLDICTNQKPRAIHWPLRFLLRLYKLQGYDLNDKADYFIAVKVSNIIQVDQGYNEDAKVYWAVINGESHESNSFTDIKDFIDTRVKQLQLDGYELPKSSGSKAS